ncbi:MAG: cyclic nucleotide-binding domain-containing protein [Bdellovibrionales bacterium]|nr:cyclic nucleotide-binding domain-containing protein [Bdellovibrionales bacterium]
MTEQRLLFAQGHPSRAAYFVNNGMLVVRLPDGPPLSIKDPSHLVGALEHFLAPQGGEAPTRLFTIEITRDSEVKKIPFPQVEDLLLEYESGTAANTFLAMLIEHTNKSYIQIQRNLPQSWKDYEETAKKLTSLVRDLTKAAEKSRIGDLERLADEYSSLATYRQGLVLLRERALSQFTIDSSPSDEFLQKFSTNAFICREQESDRALYILLSGTVGVLVRGKYVAKISKAGEAFGELSLFLRGKRTADLVAETPTSLYRITPANLPKFHASHPKLFLSIARTLAERVRNNCDKLALLAPLVGAEGNNPLHQQIEGQLSKAKEELSSLQQKIIALKRLSNIPELTEFIEKAALTET